MKKPKNKSPKLYTNIFIYITANMWQFIFKWKIERQKEVGMNHKTSTTMNKAQTFKVMEYVILKIFIF